MPFLPSIKRLVSTFVGCTCQVLHFGSQIGNYDCTQYISTSSLHFYRSHFPKVQISNSLKLLYFDGSFIFYPEKRHEVFNWPTGHRDKSITVTIFPSLFLESWWSLRSQNAETGSVSDRLSSRLKTTVRFINLLTIDKNRRISNFPCPLAG